ncbi:MAG: hypothetical protein OEW88_09970 [Gammaproteobacteria bacterium]|jgi:hypothetical protein|nr:hypothetical protein [Gammaproteobacteria bacterium]
MERSDPQPTIISRQPTGDDSLINWMLRLSPAERLQVLQGFVDSVSELRRDQPTAIQRRT